MSKSPITCHGASPLFLIFYLLLNEFFCLVLDSTTGKPAENVFIRLQLLEKGKAEGDPDIFHPLAKGSVNTFIFLLGYLLIHM